MFITIAATIIAVFIVGFFYLWIVNVALDRMGWPPAGTQLPPALYPGIEVLLLGICAFTTIYGGKYLERGHTRIFVLAQFLCSGMAATSVLLRWLQSEALPFGLGDNAYTSFVWILTGYHLMHVVAALFATAILAWLAIKGYINSERRLGVDLNIMHWKFTALSWIPIYLMLYWLPRWTQ